MTVEQPKMVELRYRWNVGRLTIGFVKNVVEVEIRKIQPDFCADQSALDTVNEAMDKIKELEK